MTLIKLGEVLKALGRSELPCCDSHDCRDPEGATVDREMTVATTALRTWDLSTPYHMHGSNKATAYCEEKGDQKGIFKHAALHNKKSNGN